MWADPKAGFVTCPLRSAPRLAANGPIEQMSTRPVQSCALESTQARRSRSAADIRSAVRTTTNMMISSIDTSRYWKRFMAVSN